MFNKSNVVYNTRLTDKPNLYIDQQNIKANKNV